MNITIHFKHKIFALNEEDKKICLIQKFNFGNILPVIEIQDGVCYLLYNGFYHEITETPEEIEAMYKQFHKEEDDRLEKVRTKEWEDNLWRTSQLDPINN